MAIRCDATTDFLERTTGMPAFGDFTACMWLYRVADPARNQLLYAMCNAAITNYFSSFIQSGSSGSVRLEGNPGLGTVTIGTFPLSSWRHIAYTFNNTTDVVQVFFDAVATGSTSTMTATTTWGHEYLCGVGTDCWDGRVAAFKSWTAVLTAAELAQEMRQYMPLRLANLHSWAPLLKTGELVDFGASVAWTPKAGAALTTEDGPPIVWNQGRRRVIVPAGAPAGPALSVSLEEPTIYISTF